MISAVYSVPYIVQHCTVYHIYWSVAWYQQCTVCHILYSSVQCAIFVQQHDVSSLQCAIYCTAVYNVPYIVQHCTVCHILYSSMMSALYGVLHCKRHTDVYNAHTHTHPLLCLLGTTNVNYIPFIQFLLCDRNLSPILFSISYLNTWNNKICFLTHALKEII